LKDKGQDFLKLSPPHSAPSITRLWAPQGQGYKPWSSLCPQSPMWGLAL
jgi:hypothetical protein